MISTPALGDASLLASLELVSRRDGEVLRVLAWRVSLSKVRSNVVVGGQELERGMGVNTPRNTEIAFGADIACRRSVTCAQKGT
jgi:hypothetical protein